MMKLPILTFLVGLLFSNASYAQTCSREGTFVGAGDVDVKGQVTLEEQADGSIQLILSSDFFSDPGPDLDLYLGNSMRVNSSSLRLEPLKSESGSQTYLLPSGLTINQYNYVTVHCTQYNHYYGTAQLGSISGTCQTLGTNTLEGSSGLEINSANGELQISAAQPQGASFLQILDLTGQSVYQEAMNLTSGIFNLTTPLNAGLYVVVVDTPAGLYSNKVYLK